MSSVMPKRACRGVYVDQGPIVQSIVSLTNSLRDQLVKCFTTLYPNILIFLLTKSGKLLHCSLFTALQKLLTFFQHKLLACFRIILTFEILTKH